MTCMAGMKIIFKMYQDEYNNMKIIHHQFFQIMGLQLRDFDCGKIYFSVSPAKVTAF